MFAGGAPYPREAFWFTQTPGKTLYVMEGSDAALEWDYSAVSFVINTPFDTPQIAYQMECL